MSDLYRQFSEPWSHLCDYSEQAQLEMYLYESRGIRLPPRQPGAKHNGYQLGKHWMDVTVSMWKEDIENQSLWVSELYQGPRLPHWWLDKLFPK